MFPTDKYDWLKQIDVLLFLQRQLLNTFLPLITKIKLCNHGRLLQRHSIEHLLGKTKIEYMQAKNSSSIHSSQNQIIQ